VGLSLDERRLVVLATYLFVRLRELEALTWEDVDLEHLTVNVHASLDRKKRKTSTTKTETPRGNPIEPSLVPLLRVMRKEAGGTGRVAPRMLAKLAPFLRRCVKRRAARAALPRTKVEAPVIESPIAWAPILSRTASDPALDVQATLSSSGRTVFSEFARLHQHVDGLSESMGSDVHVALRHAEVGVPRERGDGDERNIGSGQVRAERVAKNVEAPGLLHTRRFLDAHDEAADHLWGDLAPILGREDAPLSCRHTAAAARIGGAAASRWPESQGRP
jgi:hypothetical protein